MVAGKKVLRLNLDESPVGLTCPHIRGNVMSWRSLQGNVREPILAEKRSLSRAHLTHVCIVCDEPEIQARLPQVLVVNRAHLCNDALQAVRKHLPANFHIWSKGKLPELCRDHGLADEVAR